MYSSIEFKTPTPIALIAFLPISFALSPFAALRPQELLQCAKHSASSARNHGRGKPEPEATMDHIMEVL